MRINIDTGTKNILRKIVFDGIIVTCMFMAISILFHFVEPFKRGFFCNDQSLMYPYKDSTIGISLGVVGFGLPIALIVITELLQWKLTENDGRKIKLFNHEFPFWLAKVYSHVGLFLFGILATELVTDVGKHAVGRLRPHFMSLCQPIMHDGTNCTDTRNLNRYIEDYTCGNLKVSERRLEEMRLSFPSGHASISMFSMTFTALYLQHRMNWNGSKLLKPFLQFILIIMAWYSALSRICDNKHHWSDVVFGALLGISFSVLVVTEVADFRKDTVAQPDMNLVPVSGTVTESQPTSTPSQSNHIQQQ